MGSGLCSGAPELGASLEEEKLGPTPRLVVRQHKFPNDLAGPGPITSSKGSVAHECLLFLEYAKDVPFSDPLRDFTCQAVSAKSHGHPFVRAWVEQDGALIGRAAEWPAKSCNEVPSWYWAQPLGFSLSQHRSSARLRLELRDQHELLGSLDVPLKDLPEHEPVLRDLTETRQWGAPKRTSQVSFQVLDAASVLRERREVWFIRHGESVWNKAQSQLDLKTMAERTDHPLSAKGREQAEALSEKLQLAANAGSDFDETMESLFQPDVVYSSPLTRAIQTSVIALGPTLTCPGRERDMVLMASSREKLNFGGFDTWSTKKGADIVLGARTELQALYEGEECCEALKAFNLLGFDAQEVADNWWCEGMAETPAQLDARLQEFMSQLLYSPHRSIVVVGHSHFFRSVFKTFLSQEFKEGPEAKLAKEFAGKKMDNCGVARLELDPSRGLAGGPIVRAEMVLGSQFVSEEGLLSCCAAAGQAPASGQGTSQEQLVAPTSAERYEAQP